ncbi:hypothetical protein APUTEX25_001582, partial [Auxenochlorella protothecoides]
RGFRHVGPAAGNALLPEARRAQGVVSAATGAALTLVLRRALIGSPSLSVDDHPMQVQENSAVAAAAATATVKPVHDVVAGAMARAASQSTIHPLDTMKVRMQTGPRAGAPRGAGPRSGPRLPSSRPARGGGLARNLNEFKGLYKGVVGAATGAGLIIGTYFAFYSTTKRFLREHSTLSDGSVAFVSGATAALGSSVVKVPLAVCIRSVQAGVYTNALAAAQDIVKAAGVRGLFTGFLPTILEDVPDMAVKFAVYETVRNLHLRLRGRHASVLEDLCIGGFAGAAAAAATTPLDVVKTVMMTTASARPTVVSASRAILREGGGARAFFRGMGPRALSNGLNSAIFFCFFEAIRQVLTKQQAARGPAGVSPAAAPASASEAAPGGSSRPSDVASTAPSSRAATSASTARRAGLYGGGMGPGRGQSSAYLGDARQLQGVLHHPVGVEGDACSHLQDEPEPGAALTCTHRLGPTGPPSSTTNGTASTSAEAPSPQHAVVPARGLPGRDYGALDRTQYGLFVQFFRQASPYIEGHRGRTFVISIPGEVVSNRSQLSALLEDIALLHGLGVRLVLVLGTPAPPVSDTSSPYPVTDSDAMERLIQAAGLARLQVEAFLSK